MKNNVIEITFWLVSFSRSDARFFFVRPIICLTEFIILESIVVFFSYER
jgi:hypothetical protein